MKCPGLFLGFNQDMRDRDFVVLLLEGDLLLVHGLDAVLIHFRRNQALHEQISENTFARNFKPALCCGALVEPAVQRLLRHQFLVDQLVQDQIVVFVAGAERVAR